MSETQQAVEYELKDEKETNKVFVAMIEVDKKDTPGDMNIPSAGILGSKVERKAVKAPTIYRAAQIVAEKIEPYLPDNKRVVGITEQHNKVYG